MLDLTKVIDVIIIGASKEGISTAVQLAKKDSNINIVIVSKNFNKWTSKYPQFPNIHRIEQEAFYTTFNRGLYGIYLKDNTKLFSCNLIIATETKMAPLKVKNKTLSEVYNKITDAPKLGPEAQAIVIGHDAAAVKLAIAAAKKYMYVYLCAESLKLSCKEELKEKFSKVKNIALLPGCKITNFSTDKEGNLKDITLDTYATIRCNAVFMLGKSEPDLSYISTKFISLDENKAIITGDLNNSIKIPGIYAVGGCNANYKKAALSKMCDSIIEKIIK